MNAQEYYSHVLNKIEHCFRYSHYIVATGNELVAEGYDAAFPALAAPVEKLAELTLERGLQIHIPLIGRDSLSVLMPLDFEIFLGDDNFRLYTDLKSQRHYFKQIIPVTRYIEQVLISKGMPYLLDFTPSGGHILFQTLLESPAAQELKKIGYLEGDLVTACNYIDPGDIRRINGISLDSARVFSALGKLAEYIAMLTMQAFADNEAMGLYPVTISDSVEHCINFDNTWNEGSPFMRSIRSPLSLHKKNIEKYAQHEYGPLVDVIGTVFDGIHLDQESDLDYLIECMWDLEKALRHAERFSGDIPCADDSLLGLLDEYMASDLYAFHLEFESQTEYARGAALEAARREEKIPDWCRNILAFPNPAALQPDKLIGFVYDFLIHGGWKPKHIANILRDLYQNPSYGWTQDFYKYPSEEKANFWARAYSAIALWKTGELKIS